MRSGYQIFATDPFKGPIASSTNAETPSQACEKCFIEFPTEEGYTDHSVKNLDTRGQYSCKKKAVAVESPIITEGLPDGPYTIGEQVGRWAIDNPEATDAVIDVYGNAFAWIKRKYLKEIFRRLIEE